MDRSHRSRNMQAMPRRALLAAGGPLLLALLAACAPYWIGEGEAALALEDIAAGGGWSRLKEQTPPPTRRTIEYTIAGRAHTGDVYRPAQGARAGIVLVPGVVPAGKDDARLVALAATLARLRFAVLVPEIPSLRRLQVRTKNVREVADAFRYLASRPDLAPVGRAGIAGFSFGAGPVLLASLQPDIRDRVRFILTVGGYYDLRNVVAYFTTGAYPGPSGRRAYRPPDPYAEWIFTRSNAGLLERAADRAFIESYAQKVIRGEAEEIAPPPGPAARAVYELLTNEDPARVPRLIDALPRRIRAELNGLNPAAHDLSVVSARVILLHGRSDDMIPYTESLALARALPPGRAELFLIDGLIHVDLRLAEDDVPHLLRAMNALLAERGDR